MSQIIILPPQPEEAIKSPFLENSTSDTLPKCEPSSRADELIESFSTS